MEKYLKYLLIGAAVIIVILAIKKGWDSRVTKPKSNLPINPADIPQSFDAQQEATRVYNDFRGWFNSTDDRMRTIIHLSEMNDSELTATYNAFNKSYSKLVDNMSMTAFIYDDFIIDFTGYKDQLKTRLFTNNLI
jgi:hypothetical protein